MLLFFLPPLHPSLATFSSSFSPPVASAVIDMPPAINQHSSRAEQRPLSEWTGLAALEKRVREGELIQLSSQESPTAHHFTSLWNCLTMYMRTHRHPHLFSRFFPLLNQINKMKSSCGRSPPLSPFRSVSVSVLSSASFSIPYSISQCPLGHSTVLSIDRPSRYQIQSTWPLTACPL